MILRYFAGRKPVPDKGSRISVQERKHFDEIRDRGLEILNRMVLPDDFGEAEKRIRAEFMLHHRWMGYRDAELSLGKELAAVELVPDLAFVFMFHGDGRIREHALRNLGGPLPSPANVFAVLRRLNDWVPQVRNAARDAALRSLPETSASVIVPALKSLLPGVSSWLRWEESGREIFGAVLRRADVAEALLATVISSREPKLGLVFRELSRSQSIDPQLERVWREARLPHIRAMALGALLCGKVTLPSHETRRVWIDRSLDRYRIEPVFLSRDVTVRPDRLALIAEAARDRMAIIRKRAADGLVLLRNDPDLRPHLEQTARRLENDSNMGVRERVAFFLKAQANL